MQQKPPSISDDMGEAADPVEIQLPNRASRRRYRRDKDKPHFKRAVADAQKGPTMPQEDAVPASNWGKPDPASQAEILKHVDVQKFLLILNALLTGQKKLVIESKRIPAGNSHPNPCDYTHTFKVEDCK